MTLPRRSVPRASYMVTRTTVNSLFLLVPSPVVNQTIEYCLARAANEYGILVHAASFESNHYHIVLTDMEGRLSEFMQEFNRTVSRCLIAYYKKRFPNRRLDAVWAPGQPFSAPALVNMPAIVKAIVYVLTNPVKDGLVRDYQKWPGFNTRPSQWLAGERVATRPAYYFKHTEERISYRIVAPKQFGDDVGAAVAAIQQHLRDELTALTRKAAFERSSYLGAKRACAVDPFSSPSAPRTLGNLNPHIAAGGDPVAMRLAIEALRSFRRAYREAWALFKQGLHAVFPGGTLLMSRRFKVPCEPLDAACWCELACC